MNTEPSNDPVNNQRRRSVFMVMRDVVLNNVPNEGGEGGADDLEANANDSGAG
jgi:hypothetical protein